MNLWKRKAIPPDASRGCVFCGNVEESTIHLFLHCQVISQVWGKIWSWLGVEFLVPPNSFIQLECLLAGARYKLSKKGFWLIWHTSIWVIWNTLNRKIFKNKDFEVNLIVEEVEVLSWKWGLNGLDCSPCMFYEWSWFLGDCFGR